MIDLDLMKQRVLDMNDPNNNYNQSDFNKEFCVNESHETYDSKITLSFKNESTNPDPEYATLGSSGFDLRANLQNEVTLSPMGRCLIPTGLFFNIPDNMEIQIRPRSGMALQNGIISNLGTIDSDYIGEIKVILFNLSKDEIIIRHGDRIAQGVLVPIISKNLVNLNKVDKIDKITKRGENGFGSTGFN